MVVDTSHPVPVTANEYFRTGQLLLEAGKPAGAIECFRLAAQRGHKLAAFNLGVGLFDTGHYAEAEMWLEIAKAAGIEAAIDPLLGVRTKLGRR